MSDTPPNQTPNPVTVVPQLVALLEALTPGDRAKAIAAAQILLGDTLSTAVVSTEGAKLKEAGEAMPGISPKGTAWQKRYQITNDELGYIFNVAPTGIEVIAASMPSKGKRLQVVDCYVVSGLRFLLQSGDTAFTDRDARELCQRVGCYDVDNHSNYLKTLGNLLVGSKDAGWKLTNPGMERAAQIIKQLNQSES